MWVTEFEAVAQTGARAVDSVTHEFYKLYSRAGDCWRECDQPTTVPPSLAPYEAARAALEELNAYGFLTVEHRVGSKSVYEKLSSAPQLTDPAYSILKRYQYLRQQFMDFKLVLDVKPAPPIQRVLLEKMWESELADG